MYYKSEAKSYESHDRLGILSMPKDKKRVSSYDGHPFRIEWLPSPPEAETADPVVNPADSAY